MAINQATARIEWVWVWMNRDWIYQGGLTHAWWRHQMGTLSALLAICAGDSPVTGEFPTQMPVTRSFDVFICAWINGWVNNSDAGDFRHHRVHYDVTVMLMYCYFEHSFRSKDLTAPIYMIWILIQFCKHGYILIPAWMSDYIHYKVRGDIMYPCPSFNGYTVEV